MLTFCETCFFAIGIYCFVNNLCVTEFINSDCVSTDLMLTFFNRTVNNFIIRTAVFTIRSSPLWKQPFSEALSLRNPMTIRRSTFFSIRRRICMTNANSRRVRSKSW